MGRWSRGAGKVFLDWIAPPPGAHGSMLVLVPAVLLNLN